MKLVWNVLLRKDENVLSGVFKSLKSSHWINNITQKINVFSLVNRN